MGHVRVRRVLTGALAVSALLGLPAEASASGPPFLAVQHTLTTGVYGSAQWFSQTSTSFTNVAVNVVRQRHGPPILDLAAEFDHRNADGTFSDTFIVSDTSSGFQYQTDPTGLDSGTLTGRVSAWIYRYPSGPSGPATVPIHVGWTGEGAITRGASAGPPGAQVTGPETLYLFGEHVSGSSRAALASGTLAGHTLSVGRLASGTIGTVTDGTIFVCLNDGCAN